MLLSYLAVLSTKGPYESNRKNVVLLIVLNIVLMSSELQLDRRQCSNSELFIIQFLSKLPNSLRVAKPQQVSAA